jgi:hypothetical protein
MPCQLKPMKTKKANENATQKSLTDFNFLLMQALIMSDL